MPQPFLISSFKHGLFQYYNPWLAPKDALTLTQNILVEQGSISSRQGLSPWKSFFNTSHSIATSQNHSTLLPNFVKNSIEVLTEDSLFSQTPNGNFVKIYGKSNATVSLSGNSVNISFGSAGIRPTSVTYIPTSQSPVRAIASFVQQGSQGYGTIAFNDTNLCVFLNGERVHNVLAKHYIAAKDNTSAYSFKAPFNFNPNSLSIGGSYNNSDFIVHFGAPIPSNSPVSSIKVSADSIFLVFKKPTKASDSIYYTIHPTDIHSNANSVISWDSSRNIIAFTNGINPITFFDINTMTLSRPPLPITQDAKTNGLNQIQTAKYLKFFNNRLLLLGPTIINTNSGQDGKWEQSIRWSSLFLDQHSDFSYWNFVADTYGYGGEFSPDTNQHVVSCGHIKDKLIVWFSNSSYLLTPTQNPSNPFVLYKINSTLLADCAHTATDTNTHSQILGQTGYIQTDGNIADRIDYNIIDVIGNINFDLHSKVSAYKFIGYSNLIVLLYPTKTPLSKEPNQAIFYNVVEDSFTTLDFKNIQLSVMGNARASSKHTWGDMRKVQFSPVTAALPFISYIHYKTQIYNIAGGTDGALYKFSHYSTDLKALSSSPQSIDWSFKTCRFAPFLEDGKASTLNYIDIYFEGQPSPVDVLLDVFINGQRNPVKTIEFSLVADSMSQTFKRVLVQASGFFIELQFRNNPAQQLTPKLKIIGMILWADPAGDIKDPKYLR